MAHIWHNLKDIFDVIEGLPGMAAFIKVFFGSEEGQEKIKKRLFTDVRDELFEDIRLLGECHRENLVRRLHEAGLRGEEDKLVWNLCKIKREVRPDALSWLNRLEDDEFKVMTDLLDDDKFGQFARRMILFFREEAAPVVRRSLDAIASAVRDGVTGVDDWAANTAAPAVRRFRTNQRWIRQSRKRRDRLEDERQEQEEQMRQQREQQTRERVTELYDQFRRDWSDRRGGRQ